MLQCGNSNAISCSTLYSPGRERLMRQAGDEIDGDIADAGATDALHVTDRVGGLMQPRHRTGLPIDKTLCAKADAIHAAIDHCRQHAFGDGIGSAFHRDLRFHAIKFPVDRFHQVGELSRGQQRGRAPAEVDGIDAPFDGRAQALGNGSGVRDIAGQTSNISVGSLQGKDARGEIAETALRPTKRNRDIKSERHASNLSRCS